MNLRIAIQKISAGTSILFLLALFFLPTFAFAAPTQETQNNQTGITYECVDGNCDFNDLIAAVRKVTNWGTLFALQFSVVVIAYAGFKYMISGDNASERAAANKMLISVVKGIVFILAAWLIVHLIVSSLVSTSIFSF